MEFNAKATYIYVSFKTFKNPNNLDQFHQFELIFPILA